ncbi:MAG TPA: DUF397 domain-containing protein [Streptosporangiaceae bacterium]
MSRGISEAGGASWRKASRSANNGECVEVAPAAGNIRVRDSKNPGGQVLCYSTHTWQSFLSQARDGRFDSPLHQD